MASLDLAAAPRGRSPRGRDRRVPEDREPARLFTRLHMLAGRTVHEPVSRGGRVGRRPAGACLLRTDASRRAP